MTASTITIESLPYGWFERPQYSPKLEVDGRPRWFVVQEDLQPFTRVMELGALSPSNSTTPEQVAHALRETASRWRLPSSNAADEALRTIETASATMIVAGQQPGFLGGPLFTLYKALSAIALARRCSELSGRSCVPVFWVAAEDHDLDEIRRARLPSGKRDEIVFALPHAEDRRPLDDYPVDEETLRVLEDAKRFLARRRHGKLAAELIDLYSNGSVAAGFARILRSLFAEEGLLFVDPSTLRRHSAPLIRRVLEDPEGVLEAISCGREQVRARGMRPFVAERFPLFIIDGGRRHYLEPVDGGFRWGGESLVPRADVLALLEESPDRFSPGALLRPFVQQAVLPSVLTVGGPAEVGYHAQMKPLARFIGSPTPLVSLRLHATLVDGREARIVATTPADRLATASTADALLAPGDEASSLATLGAHARDVERDFHEALAALPSGKRRERLTRKVERLRGEIMNVGEQIASERRNLRKEESERASALWSTLFPGGQLQERHWSFLHYVAKHGRAWISELLAALVENPLELAHRLVVFGPAASNSPPDASQEKGTTRETGTV